MPTPSLSTPASAHNVIYAGDRVLLTACPGGRAGQGALIRCCGTKSSICETYTPGGALTAAEVPFCGFQVLPPLVPADTSFLQRNTPLVDGMSVSLLHCGTEQFISGAAHSDVHYAENAEVNLSMTTEPSFLSRFTVRVRRGASAAAVTEIASQLHVDVPITSNAVVQLRLARRPEYGLALSSRVSQTHHTSMRTPSQFNSSASPYSGGDSLRIAQQLVLSTKPAWFSFTLLEKVWDSPAGVVRALDIVQLRQLSARSHPFFPHTPLWTFVPVRLESDGSFSLYPVHGEEVAIRPLSTTEAYVLQDPVTCQYASLRLRNGPSQSPDVNEALRAERTSAMVLVPQVGKASVCRIVAHEDAGYAGHDGAFVELVFPPDTGAGGDISISGAFVLQPVRGDTLGRVLQVCCGHVVRTVVARLPLGGRGCGWILTTVDVDMCVSVCAPAHVGVSSSAYDHAQPAVRSWQRSGCPGHHQFSHGHAAMCVPARWR